MEPLSPRANGLEDNKCRELAAADLGEATQQHVFDTDKVVLRHAQGLDDAPACPADHPVDECPHVMMEVLDKRLDGLTIEELAAETGRPVPSAS
jgi:hypothetical protein